MPVAESTEISFVSETNFIVRVSVEFTLTVNFSVSYLKLSSSKYEYPASVLARSIPDRLTLSPSSFVAKLYCTLLNDKSSIVIGLITSIDTLVCKLLFGLLASYLSLVTTIVTVPFSDSFKTERLLPFIANKYVLSMSSSK